MKLEELQREAKQDLNITDQESLNQESYKNQNIKYSNSDKNYFNNIIKTEKNVSVLNEIDIKKDINYYNSSDSQKFEQLNSFPEYKYNNEDKNQSMNAEMVYSSNDYGEFNKIIQKQANHLINEIKNSKELENKMIGCAAIILTGLAYKNEKSYLDNGLNFFQGSLIHYFYQII